MRVVDPDGEKWRVKRRWVPWRRKVRDFSYDVPLLSGGDDPISFVLMIVGVVIAIPLVIVAIVATIELVALVALIPVAMAIRVLFGGAWPIEVLRARKLQHTEYVAGWSASRDRIHDIAEHVRLRGSVPGPVDSPAGGDGNVCRMSGEERATKERVDERDR